jgi:hypothetical protein
MRFAVLTGAVIKLIFKFPGNYEVIKLFKNHKWPHRKILFNVTVQDNSMSVVQ